jgi:hypothetical protein
LEGHAEGQAFMPEIYRGEKRHTQWSWLFTDHATQSPTPYLRFKNWPIPEARYTTLFLDNAMAMSPLQPKQNASLTYQADAPAQQIDNDPEELRFEHTFKTTTHIIGYSRTVLYMSCEQADDLDVFVQLRKADRNGKLLQNLNIPLEDLGLQAEEEVEAINPLKYLGPSGILRASHREIDALAREIRELQQGSPQYVRGTWQS